MQAHDNQQLEVALGAPVINTRKKLQAINVHVLSAVYNDVIAASKALIREDKHAIGWLQIGAHCLS